MQNSKYKIFPWRKENSFKLLTNGSVFYPKMLSAIDNAKKLILLETYFVESGTVTSEFIAAITKASKRGVNIFILFDDMGARGLSKCDKNILGKSRVHLCFYHPVKFSSFLNNFYRDHRKLLLIDDEVAFVGGAGLSDQFIGDKFWRDNMIEIKGPVIKDWHALYVQNWKRQSDTFIPCSQINNLPLQLSAMGKVSYTKGYFFNQIKKNLYQQIATSKTRIWLASAYFVPSLKLRYILTQAAKRRVDIRLMVPGAKTDNYMSRYIGQGYYSKLLKNNIKIFEYQNRFIHSKVVLIDDWVTMGSSNLDRWAAKWNLEANQEILDSEFSLAILKMYHDDLKNCQEIILKDWQKRALTQKFKVWFWKYIGKLIAKIGLNGRQ